MRKLVIGFCALVMFIITPSAQADPLVIDGGQFFVDSLVSSPHYTIQGENFSISGSGGNPGNVPVCNPCFSGVPVNVSSTFSGTSLGSGSATFDNITFNNIGFLGQFNFVVQPFVLPVTEDNLIGAKVEVDVPFTFTGTIQGCSPSNVNCTTEVFSTTQLVGEGIAKTSFIFTGNQNGVSVYTFTSVRYDFRPIPEPVTITLLASGLLGLGVKLRKRRRI
jgi:hypothetical protein